MRVPTLLASLLLALAGCSDDAPEATADAGALDADASPEANVTAPPEPVLEALPILLEGDLGTTAYACEYQTVGTCQGLEIAADATDLYHEQPGATLVAATLTLAWDATSPATDTLGIGLMRMGDNSTHVDAVEGTSPLTIEAADLDLLLDDENLLHVYVYNARGNVHQPPFVLYGTTDQPFTVEGSLTMRVPADGSAGP